MTTPTPQSKFFDYQSEFQAARKEVMEFQAVCVEINQGIIQNQAIPPFDIIAKVLQMHGKDMDWFIFMNNIQVQTFLDNQH